jgi:hypothetical protein
MTNQKLASLLKKLDITPTVAELARAHDLSRVKESVILLLMIFPG